MRSSKDWSDPLRVARPSSAEVSGRVEGLDPMDGAPAEGSVADDRRDTPAAGLVPMLELAHDVRQPLAVVRTLVDTFRTDPDVSARQHAVLDAIDDQLSHLSELTDAALDQDAGPDESIRLDRLLTAAGTALACIYGGRIHLSLDEVTVIGNVAALWRAFTNIIDNACRAAGSEGRVDVTSASRGTGCVSIDVADDGPGFGAVTGVTGIGLVVAIREVHELGGSVEFHGGRDSGTIVRVVLPVADGQLTGEDASPNGSPR